MTSVRKHISDKAIERRKHWIEEIVKIGGTFGDDSARVESELGTEALSTDDSSLIDHVRLCGVIPESYAHDSSEEKLYSKYTDVLLAVSFRSLGLKAHVLTERAGVADVEVFAEKFSFVADAKAFRLSRTAKNQKDFKIQAMDQWKNGNDFALLVAPLYQLPNRTSAIYYQAAHRDVCIFTYSHLAVLLRYAQESNAKAAQDLLLKILSSISKLTPTEDAYSYWSALNTVMLDTKNEIDDLWAIEKAASAEALTLAKDEGLLHLASERKRLANLSHTDAIAELLKVHKLDNRIAQIQNAAGNNLMSIPQH